MSAIYNLEPQPTASAIVHTSLGELMVELFAKQTPLACRNFLQLSLDGYYDGTVFHRLVPAFILQGGDPTGSGNGGESIYDGGALGGDLDPWPMDQRQGHNAGTMGIQFKDEFHSRLKFNRRGLLAMANEGRPNTNGSQFFFTLDKTEELNGKNTLFGRVAGDTIYNLAKMGESEVDPESERPLYPVKIERIEILVNPFDDMKKRSRVAAQAPNRMDSEKEAKKKKKRKNTGKQLLSFADEEGADDGEAGSPFKKTKFDARLVTDEDEESRSRPEANPKRTSRQEKKAENRSSEVEKADDNPLGGATKSKSEQRGEGDAKTHRPRRGDHSPPSQSPEHQATARKSALEAAEDEFAALTASMRRGNRKTEAGVEEKKVSVLESMIPETSIRGRKRRPGGGAASSADDAATQRLLKDFQSRLDKAPAEPTAAAQSSSQSLGDEDAKGRGSQGKDEETALCDLHFIANCQSCTAWDQQEKEESDDEGWMSHSLSFAADRLGKDLRTRQKAEEELVVIDPREKARSLGEEERAARKGRAWDRERDQARNAQLARAASLAGRGAK